MRHEKASMVLELARRLAASAEGMTLDEIAQAMGVGRRTAERMRDAVAALFPQMETLPEGVHRRFRISGGLDSLYQTPTGEELAELAKSAAALRAEGAERRAETLENLERKVRAALKRPAMRRLAPDLEAMARAETIAAQAGPRPHEDPAVVDPLRRALTAMRAVSFVYHGGRTPGARRTVTPYGLMFGRMNYLVAVEDGAETPEPRNWRLDRMAELEVLDRPAAPPPAFRLEDYAARSFGIYQDDVEEVELLIAPEGAEDALRWRFHPTQTLRQRQDGSVEVRFRAAGMRELAWHLFSWGDRVRIAAPERLRAIMVEELNLALKAHGGGAGPEAAAPPP